MRKSVVIVITILIIIGVIFKIKNSENQKDTLFHNTNLIQEQIKNVGKLIVTEGHFSEVITYKDNKKYFLDFLSFEKKVLIVINTDVTIAYDLREIEYDIDEKNKIVIIKNIPQPEITINPDIQFYDVNQSKINPFTVDDYNKINKQVRIDLAKKIEQSSFKANAQNRLISELQKLLIVTNSMGWKLEYKNHIIEEETMDKVLL